MNTLTRNVTLHDQLLVNKTKQASLFDKQQPDSSNYLANKTKPDICKVMNKQVEADTCK